MFIEREDLIKEQKMKTYKSIGLSWVANLRNAKSTIASPGVTK